MIYHKEERKQISIKAYNTMNNLWSPKQAAERFLKLAECLSKGMETPFIEGPCSKAKVLHNNWYKK